MSADENSVVGLPPRMQRRTLGKGLGALLGEAAEDYAQLDTVRAQKQVPIEQLAPGPFQPRRVFEPEALAELTQSIRECGVLQPILVRRTPGSSNSFQIIAGERRWRASQKAGLHEVPVVIRDMTDTEALEAAIIENIQRADLSPIEEAEGYQRLIAEFGHTHEALAKSLGKSRVHITNTLRLLKLPESVRTKLSDGSLTAGHARAILTADNPEAMMERILTEGLSVRATEALVKEEGPARKIKPRQSSKARDPNIEALEQEVCAQLGLKVTIAGTGDSGTLMVQYKNLDQLDLVLMRLCGHKPGA